MALGCFDSGGLQALGGSVFLGEGLILMGVDVRRITVSFVLNCSWGIRDSLR